MAQTLVQPAFATIGDNPTRLWGMSAAERVRRIAVAANLPPRTDPAQPAVLANVAFAFDPAWLRHLVGVPGAVLTMGGVPVLAHVRSREEAERVEESMARGTSLSGLAEMHEIAFDDGPTIENKALRKRETPFVTRLLPENLRVIERASYFGAYKGVTDLLTKYLWPEWALVLTRICAKVGITPNQVTIIGAVLCVLATWCFAEGRYWLGMASGLAFMVLDTVDGKLARCTITSSRIGNILDHGMDLVHPPFWWWFWATGLAHWGLALDEGTFWWVQGALLAGYIVQRLIEGAFIQLFGIHIHVWERFDSRFRLVTARRNPNMVILAAATLAGRPDIGIVAVAWWTALCCAVHAVRLLEALIRKARGMPVRSWLADPA
jgi:phosphatidylglycerophosphate synthase